MTTRWRPDFDPEQLYFVTTTTAEHSPIFQREAVKRIVADSLHYVSLMNRVLVYGFVIMPNHVHAIIQCPPACPLKDWARAFKAGASRLIVRLCLVESNEPALATLSGLVARPNKQEWKVWEDGYLAKAVLTPTVLAQKLTYVHNNPTQPHWQLVNAPEDYAWSSARFYLGDGAALIPVRDVRELMV
jgi:putative transposase